MTCLVCRQAELVNGLASAVFTRGEATFSVISIPARICPYCGDAVVEQVVALNLLQGVDELIKAGWLEGSWDYSQIDNLKTRPAG